MEVKISSVTDAIASAMMDASVKSKVRLSVINEQVSCKPGCNHCCSRLVYITVAEAVVMRKRLEKLGYWKSVRTKAESLNRKSMSVDSKTWFLMNIKCPVLDLETGKCMAYEVRPPACSTHFALSNPSSCDPWSMEQSQYIPWSMSDIFEEFAKTVSRNCEGIMSTILPMSTALLVSEKASDRSGLTVDEVLAFVAKNT